MNQHKLLSDAMYYESDQVIFPHKTGSGFPYSPVVISDMGVKFWLEISNCVISLVYQWDMKKCEEMNSAVYSSWHTGGYPYHRPGL